MGDLSPTMTVSRGREFNFTFAFNDFHFSDRILRLEITPDDNGDDMDSDKKLTAEKYNDWFSGIQSKDSESSDAAKLFRNGMRESEHNSEVCLKINASEEATLMELLRFMYGNCALKATSFNDLVDLLIAADKFEVISCMSHCAEMLQKFPMSLESALLYLELPSSVLSSEIVKPLIDAAKQFVFALHKDFNKSQEKAMQLHVSAIEAILGSKGLQVVSEDVIFDFVLKWARSSYPKLDERREILTNRLAPLIWFPKMSIPKLKEALACADFGHENVSKLVQKALFSKVELSCGQLLHDTNSKDLSAAECVAADRVYNPHCVVFFDLTKDECKGLLPSKRHASPQFCLGGTQFYLLVLRNNEKDGFGLYMNNALDSETCTIDFEISVMENSSREFESMLKEENHTLETGGWGLHNLLGITWAELMSDDSDYFINGVLRIKAELTLKDSKP